MVAQAKINCTEFENFKTILSWYSISPPLPHFNKSVQKEISSQIIDTSFTLEQKMCRNTNQTVFDSEENQKAVFTASNAYKKKRNGDFHETTAIIPLQILKYENDVLPQSEKDAFSIIAERDCEKAWYLWEELIIKTK